MWRLHSGTTFKAKLLHSQAEKINTPSFFISPIIRGTGFAISLLAIISRGFLIRKALSSFCPIKSTSTTGAKWNVGMGPHAWKKSVLNESTPLVPNDYWCFALKADINYHFILSAKDFLKVFFSEALQHRWWIWSRALQFSSETYGIPARVCADSPAG